MTPRIASIAALVLLLAAGCSRTDNEPGPGGVTVSEAKALDDAAGCAAGGERHAAGETLLVEELRRGVTGAQPRGRRTFARLVTAAVRLAPLRHDVGGQVEAEELGDQVRQRYGTHEGHPTGGAPPR